MSSQTVLNLDPSEYPGGIAIWGAMQPVLDTTSQPAASGVHVHARKRVGKQKEIDETFSHVNVTIVEGGQSKQVRIDGTLTQAFNLAEILGLPLDAVTCPSCGSLHFDEGIQGLVPHNMHTCESCGHSFNSDRDVISNPLSFLRARLHGSMVQRAPIESTRVWRHKMQDWSQGVQIWGSNSAVLWTAERPEESGIHVHAFNKPNGLGLRLADETFGHVELDGILLDPNQIRLLMAQLACPQLRPYVASIECPLCQTPHFNMNFPANPAVLHVCANCGHGFQTSQAVIANPAKAQMEYLRSLSGFENGNG